MIGAIENRGDETHRAARQAAATKTIGPPKISSYTTPDGEPIELWCHSLIRVSDVVGIFLIPLRAVCGDGENSRSPRRADSVNCCRLFS